MSWLEFGQYVHGYDFPIQAFKGTIYAASTAEKNQSSHLLRARFSHQLTQVLFASVASWALRFAYHATAAWAALAPFWPLLYYLCTLWHIVLDAASNWLLSFTM